MRIIQPHALTLQATGTPAYVQAAWSSSSVVYAHGARVRHLVDGAWIDFHCTYSHTSSTSLEPGTINTYWHWVNKGSAAVATGYTYTTNVQLTAYNTWTSGQAVTAGAAQFDNSDLRDYRSTIAVSAGDNTLRPSDAINSSTESIAARWQVLGPANAWAPYDQEVFSRLLGFGTSNTLVSPVTATTGATPSHLTNCLMFAGLKNVKTLTATVSYDAAVQETLGATNNLLPADPHWGRMQSSIIFDFEDDIPAGKAVTVAFSATAYNTAAPVEIGLVCLGTAIASGDAEWGVSTSILSFSRKERDTEFGTTTFLKRGSATVLSATGVVGDITADTLLKVLADLDGEPLMFDFNGGSSDYDRLRIFGFFSNFHTVVHGAGWEAFTMDVESLLS